MGREREERVYTSQKEGVKKGRGEGGGREEGGGIEGGEKEGMKHKVSIFLLGSDGESA